MSNPEEVSIDNLLAMAIDIDKTKRNTGMTSLNQIAEKNLSIFLLKLGTVLSDESKPSNIRQLAAILIKNSLIHVENFKNSWINKISVEEKNKIRLLVLSTLASSKTEIRTSASTVISSICKIDNPITKSWPDLLPSLTKNAFNENINMKLAAIETLGYVCEELSIKSIDSSSVDSIMNALIQNLTNDSNDVVVILQLLKALYYSIKLAEKNFNNPQERSIIMNAIFHIGTKYETNEDVLEKIAMLFIEMLSTSNYYDYLEDFFMQIVRFSFNLVQNKKNTNEKLALLCLEIICCIGDEETSRLNPLDIAILSLPQGYALDNSKKMSKCYLTKICGDLQKLIVSNVQVPEDDEDENEWNISKACLYIMNLIVQTVDFQSIKPFYSELTQQIKTSLNNNEERAKCWLLFACSICVKHKIELIPLLSESLKIILHDIQQAQSPKLRRCASFLIYKIIKIFPKIFDSTKLSSVIDVITECIKNNNDSYIIMNLCKSLQNIIKAYGDLETNKSSCTLSSFFEKIFKGLFFNANTEIKSSKEGTKTTLSRLMTIGVLIDYSSHDKQVQIKEIIIQFLKEIESTQSSIDSLLSKGYSKETIFQIQEFYYSLLQKLFNKYKTQIPLDLSEKIWLLTEQLFSYRQGVFEEANLALAALARNMGQSFKKIFLVYYPYIEFSIKSYSNNSLSKSGLLSLLNCITSTQDSIGKSKEMIKILIDVCTSNEVARANKCIAITCLGEIALSIGTEFQPYLEVVMKLLFSAAQMGVDIPEGTDEDVIEFVKSLRYELVQTFTCIELTFNDNKDLLLPYIRNIYEFLKFCVFDKNIQRFDILKSILGLIIDLFDLYGTDFKQLCDGNFASKLIELIESYNRTKNGSSDPEVEQNIDLLKTRFKN